MEVYQITGCATFTQYAYWHTFKRFHSIFKFLNYKKTHYLVRIGKLLVFIKFEEFMDSLCYHCFQKKSLELTIVEKFRFSNTFENISGKPYLDINIIKIFLSKMLFLFKYFFCFTWIKVNI